jgi:hypothetical protein
VRSTKLPSWLERLAGLDSVPVPPHVFSVDGEQVRYAWFARERHGFRCRAYREQELPADAFLSGLLGGPLRDPAAFEALLGGLLSGLPGAVRSASLVVPDAWLRVAFSESGDLPRAADQLDEVLRWKLRRLVPFRIDELRVSAAEVPPLPGQEEPRRLLLGFAVEQLLAQLEAAFAAHGVRLGQISNASLSLLAALTGLGPPRGDELTAAATVDDHGYTLAFLRCGAPVLHRYKGFMSGAPGTASDGARTGSVLRDLKLTRNFLDEQFPGVALARVLLAAEPQHEPLWVDLLAEGLGEPAAPLDGRHLPPLRSEAAAIPAWRDLAPMLGAIRQEVA